MEDFSYCLTSELVYFSLSLKMWVRNCWIALKECGYPKDFSFADQWSIISHDGTLLQSLQSLCNHHSSSAKFQSLVARWNWPSWTRSILIILPFNLSVRTILHLIVHICRQNYPKYTKDSSSSNKQLAGNKPLSLPVKSKIKSGSSKVSWNEWITLPLAYSFIPLDTQLAITVWSCTAPRKHVAIAGSTFALFGKLKYLMESSWWLIFHVELFEKRDIN